MAVTQITGRQIAPLDLTTEVTGTLPVANGGTGAATLTGMLKGTGTTAIVAATAGIDYSVPSGTENLANKTFNDGTSTFLLLPTQITWAQAADSTKRGRLDIRTDQTASTTRVHQLPTADSYLAAVGRDVGVYQPVRVVCETGNTITVASGSVTTITGTTIDGVSVAVGDRVLVLGAPTTNTTAAGAANTTAAGNGFYRVTAVATNITVARDVDLTGNVPWGMIVLAREGTSWGNYFVSFKGTGAFTPATTALGYYDFWQLSSGYIYATQAVNLTNKTLTSPKVNQIIDTTNGLGVVNFVGVSSAVNYSAIANAATGNAPGLSAVGSDTNIDYLLSGKGTGVISIRDTAGTYREAATKSWQMNAQTGTTYTFAIADSNTVITASNAAAQTYTFPQNSAAAIPIGSEGEVIVIGAGQVTFAAGTGATLLSRGSVFKSAGQYAVIGWRKTATNTFVITGDLVA